jgi:sulfite exporter TauE/SafE/copper chaperone CopZ
MIKTLKFKICGMHCASCQTLLESELSELPGINKVKIDINNHLADIEFEENTTNKEMIFDKIKALSYNPVDLDKNFIKPKNYNNIFWVAGLIILGIAIYLLVMHFGGFQILSKLSEGNVGYGLIFIIGLLAGFHCVGMCGSLVVTYSTICFDENEKKKSLLPHLQYNIGRIVSYSVIGGILGGFGSFFAISPTFTGVITLFAGIFMLIMGLSFIFRSTFLDKIKIKTPQFLTKYILSQKNKKRAPIIIGLLNGLMPCGPLQAMQLYALGSGSALRGALSLFLFALGTSVLMFGFGAVLSIISQAKIKNILKFSGALVIILAIFMINRGLLNFGYQIDFGLNTPSTTNQQVVFSDTNAQVVNMDLTASGYQPDILYIKKDIPVRWVINVKQLSGCLSAIMIKDYNIYQKLHLGENVIEFTPKSAGEIKFSCGMQMVWGKFIVN